MNNTQEKVMTSASVEAPRFHDLIAGALTHASKDKTLPGLNGIYLGREEGKIIAVATDRYRLIEGKVESEGEGESKPVRLSYDDAKALASTLSKIKRGIVTITMAGDIINISASGYTYEIPAHLDELPPYRHFFDDLDRSPVDFPHLSVNPSFFADYGKIIGKRGSVIVRQWGANKPYHIQLTDTTVEWRAMLMPMRVSN